MLHFYTTFYFLFLLICQLILEPGSVTIEFNTRIVVLIDLSAFTNVILHFYKYSDESLNSSNASGTWYLNYQQYLYMLSF